MIRAEIIAVGDELLRGFVVNTNAAFLAQKLAELGFELRNQTVVPDSSSEMLDALRTAANRSHVIVLCGGLGPTGHDITKETIAKSLNMTLVLHEETAQRIRDYIAKRGIEETEGIMKQALVIEGADVLPNDNGTAPGMVLRSGNQIIIMLPGPPSELQPMFNNYAVPILQGFSGKICCTKTLKTVGLGEPEVEEAIREYLYHENPNAALYVNSGEVQVKIYAEGDSEEDAKAKVEDLVSAIREQLGDFIFSEDDRSLEEVVVDLYKEKHLKLATAESCTGGLVAAKITSVAGSSEIFDYGLTCYADWVKRHDLAVDRGIISKYSTVSAPAAAEMARGALENGKADIAISITGIAGPGTGDYNDQEEVGLVYIAAANRDRTAVRECHFGNRSRDTIRENAAKTALEMARRMALGLDIPEARYFGKREIADLHAEKPITKDSIILKRTIATALALIMAGSGLYAGISMIERSVTHGTYNKIKAEYVNAASEKGTDGAGLEELSLQNPNVSGWLVSDNLGIDGVVVLADSNDYYLNHDFYGNTNRYGCLFFDPDVLEAGGVTYCDNLVIRGSSIDPNEMFGPLLNITDISVLRNAPMFSLQTASGTTDYKIVSVYYANTSTEFQDIQDAAKYSTFASKDEFISFVTDLKMRSLFSTPVDIMSGDRFVTLTTKTNLWNGSEIVVVGRAVRADESVKIDPNEIIVNPSAVYPEHWYELNSMDKPDTETQLERWKSWLIGCDPSLSAQDVASVEIDEVKEQPEAPQPTIYDIDPTANIDINYDEVYDTPAIPDIDYTAVNEDGTPNYTTITVTNAETGELVTGSPIDIVSQMVEAEIGSSMHTEAIKAQAVAMQTLLRFMYRTQAAPSVRLKTASQTVIDCVSEVINEVMYYNGQLIYSPYCVSVAGKTNSSGDIWIKDLPYLQSVSSEYDYLTANYSNSYNYTKDAMQTTLEKYYNLTLSDDPANWLKVVSLTTGGYVDQISIDGQYTTSGESFRTQCMNISSSAFTVQYDPNAQLFTIVTEGNGNGVGMSEWGANYFATKDGMTYEDILKHYYTGIELGGVTW